MSEWKPGDVVRLGNNVAMRVEQDSDAYFISPIGTHWRDCEHSARPLVVIDPEDREAAERLLANYYTLLSPHMERAAAEPSLVDDMQAALREFANPTPPKPDEPTGLGAVVEDGKGVRWTRVKDGFNWRWRDDRLGEQTAWEYLVGRVVRVLSEGVQP